MARQGTRPRRSAGGAPKVSPQKRGMYRGAAAREKADIEHAAVEARREARKAEFSGPMRLYLKQKETREVCIVDEAPDFFMFEHQIYNHGRPNEPRYSYCGCVKEFESCPACTKHGDSNYNMYLTVIDFAEFTDSKNVVHEFSKKLMVIKSGSQRKFIRRHQKNGSLRGQVVTLTRDTDKDPVIGNDIEWEDKIPEDELMGNYLRSWTDRKGKTHEENCGEPYAYEELFQEPTVENIVASLHGENAVDLPEGSRAQAAEELEEETVADDGVDGWGEDAGPDDVPFDADAESEEEDDEAPVAPPPAARAASRRSSRRRL